MSALPTAGPFKLVILGEAGALLLLTGTGRNGEGVQWFEDPQEDVERTTQTVGRTTH